MQVATDGGPMSASTGFSVPETYPELQARYGTYIRKLLAQHNKYEDNLDDIHGYVWLKLLEAEFLARFSEYIRREPPKLLSALEACDALGVSWNQWVAFLWANRTDEDEAFVVTPVNLEDYDIRGVPWYNSPEALFSGVDVIGLSAGALIHGEPRWAFECAGQDVRGGVVYNATRPEGLFKYPKARVPEKLFENYLKRAVLNHYANFCRTQTRRHKERPQTPQGEEGHLTYWEDTLIEENEPSIEVRIEEKQARMMLRQAARAALESVGIRSGDEEEVILALLDQGLTLAQALRERGYSPRLRKSLVRSIQTRALRAVSGWG